eukprot:2088801-Rhodomonas_salina.1
MPAGREILFNYNSVNSAEECLCGAEWCTRIIGRQYDNAPAIPDPATILNEPAQPEKREELTRAVRGTLRSWGCRAGNNDQWQNMTTIMSEHRRETGGENHQDMPEATDEENPRKRLEEYCWATGTAALMVDTDES